MGDSNGHLSNFEKWRIFTDGLSSPDSFIDFGFYFMIGAALQRRVWLPPKHKPIYLNPYIAFIAPPGIGKGLVITEVSKMLKFHKKDTAYSNKTTMTGDPRNGKIEVDRGLVEAMGMVNTVLDEENEKDEHRHTRGSKKEYEKPLLFPSAPDTVSYEALVVAVAKAFRYVAYAEVDAEGNKHDQIYGHSSINFCLEEFSSLFRKKAEDIVNFLQIGFDCGDYAKNTKTQGNDRVKGMCVALLGGATQEFMQRLYKDDLANEGFASRTIFLYEPRDRKPVAFIPELTPFQKKCQIDLLDHLKKLSTLFGQVEVTPAVIKWIEDWNAQAQLTRTNTSEKLRYYYARKKVHLCKIAAAMHFGESLEMKMDVPVFERALEKLNAVEKTMHYALLYNNSNPHYKLSLKMVEYIKLNGKGMTRSELIARCYEHVDKQMNPIQAIDDTITYLEITGKLRSVNEGGKIRFELIKQDGEEPLTTLAPS